MAPASGRPGDSTLRQRRLAFFAWVAVCLVWGTTYLGIRITLETMPPALMGGFRWTIAGTLLAAYVRATGDRLPPRSQWGGIALLGFLLLGLGNGGVVFAEQWIPSGLTAVLVASSPFWMTAIEAALPHGEPLRARVIAGLVVGFGGILVLVWPDLTVGGAGQRRFLAGVIALQIASAGWALGSSYSRRHARGEWAHLSFIPRTAWALVYLSTLGAIGGFVAYTYALRHLAVSFVSLYAYVNPVIAVALGVVLLGEPFDARMATAALLVFAGVAIVRLSPNVE